MSAAAQLAKAKKCLRTKQGEEALKAAAEAKGLFDTSGDKAGVADAARAAIVATAVKGEVSAALQMASDELEGFKAAGDKCGEAVMLQAQAEVQIIQGLPEGALATIASTDLLRVDLAERPLTLAGVELTQADAHLAKKAPKAALNAASKAMQLATTAGDKLTEAMAWEAMMNARMGLDKYDEGLKAAEAALVNYMVLNDETGKACTLYALAKAHNANKNYAKAMKAGGLALEHFKKCGSRLMEQAALDVVVKALLGKEAKGEALRQARQGAAQLQAGNNKLAAGLALMTVAEAYAADFKKKEAIMSAKDALAIFKQVGDMKQEGYALCEISRLYTEMAQMEQAKETAQEAVQLFNNLHDPEGGAYALEMLGSAEDAKTQMEREMELQAEVKEMVKSLKEALETRDGPAFKAALDKAYASQAVEMELVENALLPLIEKDPEGTREFWEANHPENWPLPKEERTGDMDIDCKFKRGKAYDRRYLYLMFRYGMMGYGPSFRSLKFSIKKGMGYWAHGHTALTLKDDHDDWEAYSAWHAGILDCALQTGAVRGQQG